LVFVPDYPGTNIKLLSARHRALVKKATFPILRLLPLQILDHCCHTKSTATARAEDAISACVPNHVPHGEYTDSGTGSSIHGRFGPHLVVESKFIEW